MTSKHDGFEQNMPAVNSGEAGSLPTDYFELLSAYIDGELSPKEKNQVQRLLDRDPKIKNLYTQLLTLQGQMQSSPAPPGDKSVAEITAGVFQSIEHRRHRRRLLWGGSAIAASILAGITGLIPGIAPELRMAENQDYGDKTQPVMLAVAVNKPAIDIPKALNGYGIEVNNLKSN